MTIDARVDRLFARAMNSPFCQGVMQVVYSGVDSIKYFSSTICDDMRAILSAGVTLENLPEPVKTFCDVCEVSFEAIKQADFEGVQWNLDPEKHEAYFYALVEIMPDEIERLKNAGFADYVNKQKFWPDEPETV